MGFPESISKMIGLFHGKSHENGWFIDVYSGKSHENGWSIDVYSGKSHENGWFRGTPTSGKLHLIPTKRWDMLGLSSLFARVGEKLIPR